MVRQKSFMQVLSEAFNARQAERDAQQAVEKKALDLPELHTGKIYSAGQNANGVPCAMVEQDGSVVEIPFQKMLVIKPGHTIDAETACRHISKMLGAEIDYIVTSVSGTKQLSGSRLAAMKRRQEEDLPKIHTGDTVRARVVTVMKRAAVLEAAGVEVYVDKKEFSWEWVSNLYERIHVGNTMDAKVLSVSHEFQRLELSPRELIESPFAQYGWMYKEQMRCEGTVTGMLDIFYYVRLDGPGSLICMCGTVKNVEHSPIIGSKVALIITQKDKERQRLRGRIVSVTQA